jgi:protein TonB
MRIYLALLLSFALHAILIVAPTWQAARQKPLRTASIEAQLITQDQQLAMADTVSTEPAIVPQQLAAPPHPLQGRALRRAQSALSEHLFYPPEAVARGLEGDVILLLTLTDNGQLLSAAIARSSGHGMLDQAALDAARHIGALPGNPHQTLFPVSFRLQ